MVYPMEKLMTIDQAARYLGMSRHRLTTPQQRERVGIPTLKLVKAVRFRRADLDAWLANHRSNSNDRT
jgi:excisionase family DNA binding protein